MMETCNCPWRAGHYLLQLDREGRPVCTTCGRPLSPGQSGHGAWDARNAYLRQIFSGPFSIDPAYDLDDNSVGPADLAPYRLAYSKRSEPQKS